MSKFLEKINRKAVVASGFALSALMSFAEGEGGNVGEISGLNNAKLDSTLVADYITNGKNQIVAVLTAGAVIVACFYIWRLIKKALNATK